MTCSTPKPPLDDDNNLWLAGDVAKELGVTPSAIRAAADDGRLEIAGRTVGGVRYFTSAAVHLFRASRASAAHRRNQRADGLRRYHGEAGGGDD